MDEFFMVRVAALQQQATSRLPDLGVDGRRATHQLRPFARKLWRSWFIGLASLL
jgi:polyphosphate kinase